MIACSTPNLTPFVDPDQDDRFTFPATCDTLFGRPSGKTGIDEELCMPTCNCNGVDWTAPLYLQEDIAALYEWNLVNPMPTLGGDPYDRPLDFTYQSDKFCGVLPLQEGPGDYELHTYDTEDDAAAAGAYLTHRGACGRCSSLQNLAVYIANPDLTDPVRRCGVTGFGHSDLARLACIASIGFDLPCAQIWDYNTVNTGKACRGVCVSELRTTHNEPDGSLNPCLFCDEVRSGEVFKAVAGRTRRNSGLPSAICRSCDGVYPVEHFYPPMATP